MVVSEIALSLMLLTGAGLVVASFQKVIDSDLGFQPDHVLSLQVFLPPDRYPSTDPTKRRQFVEQVGEAIECTTRREVRGCDQLSATERFLG